MLSIRSSELIHFIAESLYPLSNLSLFLQPPSHWQLLFQTLFLWVSLIYLFIFTFYMYMTPCRICLSLSDWSLSAEYPPGPSMFLQMAGFPSSRGWIIFHVWLHISHLFINLPLLSSLGHPLCMCSSVFLWTPHSLGGFMPHVGFCHFLSASITLEAGSSTSLVSQQRGH